MYCNYNLASVKAILQVIKLDKENVDLKFNKVRDKVQFMIHTKGFEKMPKL